jgi:8-oxo-dGTP pyrophosphatase MutT (NUDIX family)
VSESPRTFRVVPPEQRPHRRRRTARVLVVDDGDRVLLFTDRDPGLPGRQWWITPGGGVDPGETDPQAAVREVEEECGLVITEADLTGPLLERHVVHGYTDVVIDQRDAYFACWVPAFEVSDAGHTPEERITMTGHRWWSREELAATGEEVWPADIVAIWDEAVRRRGRPPEPPLDGGSVEESTVPA